MKKQKEKKDKRNSLAGAAGFVIGCLALMAFAASVSARKSKKKKEDEEEVFLQMASLKNKTVEDLTILMNKLSYQQRFDDAAVVRDVINRKIKELSLKQSKA